MRQMQSSTNRQGPICRCRVRHGGEPFETHVVFCHLTFLKEPLIRMLLSAVSPCLDGRPPGCDCLLVLLNLLLAALRLRAAGLCGVTRRRAPAHPRTRSPRFRAWSCSPCRCSHQPREMESSHLALRPRRPHLLRRLGVAAFRGRSAALEVTGHTAETCLAAAARRCDGPSSLLSSAAARRCASRARRGSSTFFITTGGWKTVRTTCGPHQHIQCCSTECRHLLAEHHCSQVFPATQNREDSN